VFISGHFWCHPRVHLLTLLVSPTCSSLDTSGYFLALCALLAHYIELFNSSSNFPVKKWKVSILCDSKEFSFDNINLNRRTINCFNSIHCHQTLVVREWPMMQAGIQGCGHSPATLHCSPKRMSPHLWGFIGLLPFTSSSSFPLLGHCYRMSRRDCQPQQEQLPVSGGWVMLDWFEHVELICGRVGVICGHVGVICGHVK
jgi:hypothetical protein